MKRREFLAASALSALTSAIAANPSLGASSNRGSLLIVELAGGNDGLNTFIPYSDPNYLRLRPTLGIQNGIPVSSTVALHPEMSGVKTLLDAGRLAVVQNVSYPNPSLSHFRAKDIWQSAVVPGYEYSGWLGRWLAAEKAQKADAVFLGDEYPLALLGKANERYLQYSANLLVNSSGDLGKSILALYDLPQSIPLAEQVRLDILENKTAVEKLAADLSRRVTNNAYPQNAIGNQFALMAKILESRPRVAYLTVGGWDTHVDQLNKQGYLLAQVSQSLVALERDLTAKGLAQSVLTLVQSEFGRRPAQNGSGGTDHGTAAPVMIMGPVRGGFYGGTPALDSLIDQNLPMQVDFRQIYGEILQLWEGIAPSTILGREFTPLGFLT
ncbi:MAG: DUF1501 domain-containing protein [Pseudanabaenaceae cyanobacterium bins.68]|nr:DUF1501 domain-containing protein [Pseudanabaenaceae cyanobacterium bins.68]